MTEDKESFEIFFKNKKFDMEFSKINQLFNKYVLNQALYYIYPLSLLVKNVCDGQ
jgi:hypothetical protein